MSDEGGTFRAATEDQQAVLDELGAGARRGFMQVWDSEPLAAFRATHSIGTTILSVFSALIGEMVGLLWAHYGGEAGNAPRARKRLILDVFAAVRSNAHAMLVRQRLPPPAAPEPEVLVHPEPKTVM
jgi:hypothetical protein